MNTDGSVNSPADQYGTQTAATLPAASARAGAQTAATARAGTQQPLREIMASEDSDEEWRVSMKYLQQTTVTHNA